MIASISCGRCWKQHLFKSNFVRCECGRWYFKIASSFFDPDTGETINIEMMVTRDKGNLKYSVAEVG